jgi:Transglutaminase-like domain
MLMCLSSRPLGSRPGNRPDSASILSRYYRLMGVAFAMGRRPASGMENTPMRRVLSQARICSWAICLGLLCAVGTVRAGGLNDLLDQKGLTPEGLARGFADFAFELLPQVQEPETFLQRKRGDCADYSNLASTVLAHHGYTTKLVVVMMAKQTHVVCYVKEAGGFLDYNHRADAHPVIPSDGSLEDIAGKVAGDFHSSWRMASFFRYRGVSPVYLDSVFATESSPARPATGR